MEQGWPDTRGTVHEMAEARVSISTVLGSAGEYYVMCQLLRRGLIAALAPAGVPHADIIVTDGIGGRLCAIQAKSRRDMGADRGWHMKAKHEEIDSPTLFYAFVDFGRDLDAHTKCFIVPSGVVADVLRRSHALWLATPGRGGRPHQDGEMRRFLPDYDAVGQDIGCGLGWLDGYREAWDLIRGPANSEPSK